MMILCDVSRSKTPGGRLVYLYTKKRVATPKCPCGTKLCGVSEKHIDQLVTVSLYIPVICTCTYLMLMSLIFVIFLKEHVASSI